MGPRTQDPEIALSKPPWLPESLSKMSEVVGLWAAYASLPSGISSNE